MSGPKRARRERTDEWANIKQWSLWPEQELYGMQRCAVSVHMKFLHNAGGDESEPLEHLTNLERKRKGENSMSGKREMEEGMYSIDSQVLCAW
jgi:hypothetical protein